MEGLSLKHSLNRDKIPYMLVTIGHQTAANNDHIPNCIAGLDIHWQNTR